MSKILVTGASGFIGFKLSKKLINLNRDIRIAARNINKTFDIDINEKISIGNIDKKTNWKNSLSNVKCIIHCAGIADNVNLTKKIDIYRSVNIDGTKNLAEQAASEGVKRFIFLSSIKVNGENSKIIANQKKNESQIIDKFTNDHLPNPQDLYAISKFEAEKALWDVAIETGLEIVIVRPPLVYGYGAKGNLSRLIKFIKSGIPLPLSLIKNHRSMIGIDNLVDLLNQCIDHPDANGKIFLASDDKDLSTPDFIKLIASSMGRKASLFPIPLSLLKFIGSVFGRSNEINRLVGSLRVDSSYTKETLNWTPPLSVEEGIRRMVQGK